MTADSVEILKQAQRQSLWASAAAILVLVAVNLLPRFSAFDHGSSSMVVTHLLLEMFSITVSSMVVVIAWYRPSDHEARMAHALIYGFTLVAFCDVIHAISYVGMPDFLSHSGTPKSVFFWLMGRSAELLTVVLIAVQARLPGARIVWLALALLCGLALFDVGTWHLDSFPQTFIPGQGVTAFKANYEIVLSAGNVLAAIFFFKRHRALSDPRDAYLAASCLVMGLGELMFTGYYDVSDFSNMFGHLFKVAAYALLFKATFYLSIHAPHVRLSRSEALLEQKRAELDTVLSFLPAGVMRIDREGFVRYINDTQARRFGTTVTQGLGKHFSQISRHATSNALSKNWERALKGEIVSFKGQLVYADGQVSHSSLTLGPEYGADGSLSGVISVVVDISEQHRLQQQLEDTLDEVLELRSALDAHAIVAVTDARGVITQVNDKFCEISQYTREELIGNTHRVINSGHHPHSFFVDLWKTISSGSVWSGEICNQAKNGSQYWVQTTIVPIAGTDKRPRQYIAIRADITERKHIELEMQQMAYEDALTKLPNRRLLMDRLAQSLIASERTRHYGALLYIDLDHFKQVNDTLGHHQGDELLKITARRLTQLVRHSDTVCRLGGDEFIIQLCDLGENMVDATSAAGDIGEKILESLNEPYVFGTVEVVCTPSIGVVMYQGESQPAEGLIKQADIALYQAKDAGRNNLCFFDPAIQQAFHERMALEMELRHAVQKQELLLHYQPIVDRERQVVGVEALLRWKHPSLGMVSPAAFIPIAEKSGLIVPIGEWVLEEAGRLLQRWSHDPARCRWTVAVNVSARQFRHPKFVSMVLDILHRNGIEPGRMKLEITESTLLSDVDGAIQNMHELRQHGIQFAIDDFGTGYSSLAYLKRLPINVLKIDQSFVRELDWNFSDQAIAKTITELGANLMLDVVAEGVETEEQFECLLQFGCQQFQGYLFGRPGTDIMETSAFIHSSTLAGM